MNPETSDKNEPIISSQPAADDDDDNNNTEVKEKQDTKPTLDISTVGKNPDSKTAALPTFCLFVALVSVIGAFENGWNTSVSNVPEKIIRDCKNGQKHVNIGVLPDCLPMENLLWGFAVGSYAIGGLIGGISAGYLQTRFGRIRTLVGNNFSFILGALILGSAVNPGMFIIGRILTGVGSGISTVTVPTYLGEIATVKARGALGTIYQLFLVIGILFTQIIGLLLSSVPGWRILLALTAIPALIQLILLRFCVETPRYLISQNKLDEAQQSLQLLRPGFDVTNEYKEIYDGQQEAETVESRDPEKNPKTKDPKAISSGARKSLSFAQLFRDPMCRKMTIICVTLSVIQQLSGINGVIFYSTSIFSEVFADNAKYATVGVGVINLIFTMVSVILIDRQGRKRLLLASEIGIVVTSILVVLGSIYSINLLVVVAVLLFVSSFAIGLGPIPFLIIPELLPTYGVSAAASLAMGLNWLSNFLVGLIFPVLKDALKNYTFLVFAIITSFGAIFTLLFVPETKGRTLEEIHNENSKDTKNLDSQMKS
uniref:Monosaccharide transporter n=1 Tax=Geosiphon pyriformis TaxID=50956 RepID=A0ZXK5_9GLOM|nr:monosaccharide transporter [Geosiphon pyriformis]